MQVCFNINLSPQSLNTFTRFFLSLSVSEPDKIFNIAMPESLFNPQTVKTLKKVT